MQLTTLAPLLMLSGLVFIHEMGHFLVAKWLRLPVETFSVGMGPRLIGFKWNETDMRLSAIPLGGYVKLAGYNPEEPEADDPHGFEQKPYFQKFLFYSGGIIANLLTAFILLIIVGADSHRVVSRIPESSPLYVAQVVKGSSAEMAGLREGDKILGLNDLRFPGSDDRQAVSYIRQQAGKRLSLLVDRNGNNLKLEAVAQNISGQGRLGILFQPTKYTEIRRPFAWSDWPPGFIFAGHALGDISSQIFEFLGRVLKWDVSSDQLAGPIGIIQQGSQAAKLGWSTFLVMAAAISLQLGILNALPIPLLDGGHVAMMTAEVIARRRFSWQVKQRILMAGFVLLITIMGSAVFLDIGRLLN
ncbi:MAG: M50 family metallopeptidase [Holophagaceae bacterium]|jgi:regulator of sigma E protease